MLYFANTTLPLIIQKIIEGNESPIKFVRLKLKLDIDPRKTVAHDRYDIGVDETEPITDGRLMMDSIYTFIRKNYPKSAEAFITTITRIVDNHDLDESDRRNIDLMKKYTALKKLLAGEQ